MCSKTVKFNVKNDQLTTSSCPKRNSNCLFCDTLSQMHKQYNIFPLLNDIIQWDDDGSSQMRLIHRFKCFVCNFDTDHFNPWKEHIMSNKHVSVCHTMNNLYSYSCGACKILFYGPKKLIMQHCNDVHRDKSKLPIVSIFMAELMESLYTNSKHLYFCAYCKTFFETQLHNCGKQSLKNIPYYCKYCDVTFLCSTEVLDRHSLSVEHVTFKCVYLINEAINLNGLKKHNHAQNIENTKDFSMKHNLSELPLIILNRFWGISELMPKCKFCNTFVGWSTENILEHVCVCKRKGSITSNTPRTCIKTFECKLCNYVTKSFSDHKIHVISPTHLTNVHVFDGFYSYFCNICDLYTYSSLSQIKIHLMRDHRTKITKLPIMSNVLADNYKCVSNNPECKSIEYYSDGLGGSSDFPIQCYACKINFRVPFERYNLHKISSEHIILEYFTSKNSSVVMNNKTLNLTNQSHEKKSDDKIVHQVRVNNGGKKKDSNKQNEVISNIRIAENDECIKNNDENGLHSVILSANIDCSEPAKETICNKLKHNAIKKDEFLENTPENTKKPIINMSTTIINGTLSNDVKLYEQSKSSESIEEFYGKYVSHRLKSIFDSSIKCQIKHEIDLLFDSKIIELTKDTAELNFN